MEKLIEMISTAINIEPELVRWGIYGVLGLLGILVLVLILCIANGCKKKKAKKQVAVQEEPAPVEEQPVVEEIKEETQEEVKVEPVQEEVKPTKKSATKRVKKEVAKEEVKEEPAPVEEPVVEEAKEEKAPAKRNLGKFAIAQEGVNYRYRLKASNGELLVVSELYASEKACRTGIETIKKNAETAKVEVVEDKHGLFSFRIMTKQGRCLATSANYKTKARALSASESFKKFVVTERVEVEEATDHFEVEEFTKEITPEEKGKYKLVRAEDGYIYQLVASNGRVIAKSQVYKSEASCKESLEKFRTLAYEGTFYIFKDKNAKYQFKLYNKQKRLVLAGEVYDTKDRVVSVIESIKRFAKLAEVVIPQVEEHTEA